MTGRSPSTGRMTGIHPVSALALRLALAPEGTGPHRIDGVWWPYSHDLSCELASLLTVLEARWSRISRVTVNASMWSSVPRGLLVDGRVVPLGSFTNEQDAQEICLLAYGVGRWDLLVVPHGTAPGVEERAPQRRTPATGGEPGTGASCVCPQGGHRVQKACPRSEST